MKKKLEARRRLLKTITTTGGITALTPLLPTQWTTPIINWVALPAHAEGSVSENAEFEGISVCADGSGSLAEGDYVLRIIESEGSPPVTELLSRSNRELPFFSVQFFDDTVVRRARLIFVDQNDDSSITSGAECIVGDASSSLAGCRIRSGIGPVNLLVEGSGGTFYTSEIIFTTDEDAFCVEALPATFMPV